MSDIAYLEHSETDNEEVFGFEDAPEFWSALMRSSIGATLVIVVSKVVLTVAYGFWSGFEIEMNRIFGFLPQFVFGLGQERFEHMVRVSWVLSSVAAIIWWFLRALSNRSDRRDVREFRVAETKHDRDREEVQYIAFIADAQRSGAWIGMWVGSLSLLGILAFEYVRKWLIDDIVMPAFPVLALLVALVPVAMLVRSTRRLSKTQTLSASEISGLLDPAVDEASDVAPRIHVA